MRRVGVVVKRMDPFRVPHGHTTVQQTKHKRAKSFTVQDDRVLHVIAS